MTKTISKEKAAEILGIKEQMVMKHAKKLRIKTGRMLVKTEKRGVQAVACFTSEQFDMIRERQEATGIDWSPPGKGKKSK